MSETFMLAFTSLGTNPEDEESRLEAKLFPKPNCEVKKLLKMYFTWCRG